MSEKRKILPMLARGGVSRSEVAGGVPVAKNPKEGRVYFRKRGLTKHSDP